MELSFQLTRSIHILVTLLFLSLAIFLIPSASHGASSCRCVAFTLDGVQDYFLTSVQKDIIKTFDQMGANLTIGIIGNDFGLDENITHFISNVTSANLNRSNIEVANNGWNGEDYITLPLDQQSDLINKTQARIVYLLKDQPMTFLAPYGNMNNDTLKALDQGDLRYASGYWDNTDVPVHLNNSGIFVAPPSMSYSIPNPITGLYEPLPYDVLLKGIQRNITDNGVAVVSMQPLEFAQKSKTDYLDNSDLEQIKNLATLLESLQKMKIQTVTIKMLSDKG